MPYLLLALGLILGGFALYKFFLKATPAQIKTFLLAATALVLLIALFFMAVTGRLAPAIGLFVALLPLVREVWKSSKSGASEGDASQTEGADMGGKSHHSSSISLEEARDILGVQQNAGRQEIMRAYKDLMKRVHPDTQGSAGLARKLNEAKDLLLSQTDNSDTKGKD